MCGVSGSGPERPPAAEGAEGVGGSGAAGSTGGRRRGRWASARPTRTGTAAPPPSCPRRGGMVGERGEGLGFVGARVSGAAVGVVMQIDLCDMVSGYTREKGSGPGYALPFNAAPPSFAEVREPGGMLGRVGVTEAFRLWCGFFATSLILTGSTRWLVQCLDEASKFWVDREKRLKQTTRETSFMQERRVQIRWPASQIFLRSR